MTNYFVGPGGNDGSAGTSWGARKLTLNGVEDIPVAAGDTVYVGPGVYREVLTVDISGSAGNVITYIADVAGENTDGVGGIVRVTGSDDDQSSARSNCIIATTKTYRTFRGFSFDSAAAPLNLATGCTSWLIEDCSFQGWTTTGIYISGSAQAAITISRCIFMFSQSAKEAILITHTSTVSNAGHVIENCFFDGQIYGLRSTRIGGVTVRNCFSGGGNTAFVRVDTALAGGQTTTVSNCIIYGGQSGFQATAAGEITENYNSLYAVTAARTNTNTGANSLTYPALTRMPMLLYGFRFPVPIPGELSNWSLLKGIAGTGESTDDLYGVTRPSTSSKKSWGAVQFVDSQRETGTVRTGSASIKLADAGRVQMFVPVTAASTVISTYTYREANYAGTNPQMVIKQPGVADRTTTDAGSASVWNQLTDTFTPSANTDFVIVELVSNNTATSGNYDVFFDDLTVS